MSLDLSKLQKDLKSVFSDMKKAKDQAKDTDFSDGVSKACKAFVESGSVSTSDTGTVSSGVFTGAGSGSVSVTQSLMSDKIVTAMNQMKNMTSGGDDVLAKAIFDGLKDMVTASNTVSTDVTGTTLNPSGSPVPPSSGKAKGSISITYAKDTFVSNLNKIFEHMIDNAQDSSFDGDVYLADELGTLVSDCVSANTVSTSGQGELSGSFGTGKLS